MNRMAWWLRSGALMALIFGASASGVAVADADSGVRLTVQQILERHAAARGGAEAWRKIQTMAWTGHIESGPGGISKRPFLMMFRRPEATRFEIIAEGQHSARIFDGTQGWKLQPTANGPPEIKDYSAEDVSFARDAGGLDGPLIDPKSKGIGVALQGVGAVEGHRAYHLKVTLPSGQRQDHWVDAQSFLELKYDRETHNAANIPGIVAVFLRNYQTVNGLVIPLLIETGGSANVDTDKMIIEKIALNPAVDNAQFSKPSSMPKRRHRVLINTARPAQDVPPGQ